MKIIFNILYAFFVQGISLFLSMIMSFVLPNLLGVREYAYWQLFLFYVSYVGFFHLGLNDGIYLRNGGKKYEELDFPLIHTQFIGSILVQAVLGTCLACVAWVSYSDKNRVLVIAMTIVYMVITNAANLLGFLFQAVNEVKTYSTSVLIDKVLFLLVILVKVCGAPIETLGLMALYCGTRLVSLLYCVWKGRDVFQNGYAKFFRTVNEAAVNISVGIKLMISTICGMLIMGVGRIFIDTRFGIEAFGIYSFSFSLVNFILQFISQVSMVMFPALKNIQEKRLEEIFYAADVLLTLVLSFMVFSYMPIGWLVRLWLPKYAESLKYFIFLLPVCVYDGKMNILYTTYYKIYRLERELLRVNVIALLLAALGGIIGTYICANTYVVVISMVFSIGVRNVISGRYFTKKYGMESSGRVVAENIFLLAFVLLTWFLSPTIGAVICAALYVMMVWKYRGELSEFIRVIRGGRKE